VGEAAVIVRRKYMAVSNQLHNLRSMEEYLYMAILLFGYSGREDPGALCIQYLPEPKAAVWRTVIAPWRDVWVERAYDTEFEEFYKSAEVAFIVALYLGDWE
jgi:hypothetical protein